MALSAVIYQAQVPHHQWQADRVYILADVWKGRGPKGSLHIHPQNQQRGMRSAHISHRHSLNGPLQRHILAFEGHVQQLMAMRLTCLQRQASADMSAQSNPGALFWEGINLRE